MEGEQRMILMPINVFSGKQESVYCNEEIILSAGAVGSPHILLLSGIGPKGINFALLIVLTYYLAHLEEVRVPVVHDLPGVGENLQDHVVAFETYETYDAVSPSEAEFKVFFDFQFNRKINNCFVVSERAPQIPNAEDWAPCGLW